ncbi:MAG: hypothetical protein WB774_19010, partial [Xanthobacteraceae bacterium]
AQCRPISNMTIERSARSITFNAAEQDARYVKKSRALQNAYRIRRVRSMFIAKPRHYFLDLFRGVAGRLSR